MKSGFVAIVGRPSVGKSTILNAAVGKKLSIVTDKAQTTRDQIKGIVHGDNYEIVFVDTPGIHKPINALGKAMNHRVSEASSDADLIVLVLSSKDKVEMGMSFVASELNNKTPDIVVINKIDLITLPEAESIKAEVKRLYPKSEIIEMSAIEHFNIDSLIKEIVKKLPEGPEYYPDDTITDIDDVFSLKEIIREKVLLCLRNEVPHNIAIYMNDIKHKSESTLINANIIVAKESHKGIVIGHNGSMIKKIGSLARKDMEEYLGKRVYLELSVKVNEDWINNPNALKNFGYK